MYLQSHVLAAFSLPMQQFSPGLFHINNELCNYTPFIRLLANFFCGLIFSPLSILYDEDDLENEKSQQKLVALGSIRSIDPSDLLSRRPSNSIRSNKDLFFLTPR